MATIALIVIGGISLLVKRNKLKREVFCCLVAGREHSMFFPAKKARNERWEVVCGIGSKMESIAWAEAKKEDPSIKGGSIEVKRTVFESSHNGILKSGNFRTSQMPLVMF
jgi:hypothetical protein